MKYLLNGEETERLHFRLLKESDFDTWLPLFETKEAIEYLGLDPKKSTRELCDIWFSRAFSRYEENRGGLNVLEDKKTGKMVGQCGLLLQEVDGVDRLEVGYSILPEHWNKGYATEAAKKCKKHAFENDFWDAIISIIHVNNIQSAMVARKNGMDIEKQTTFKGIPVNIFRVDKDM